MNLSLYNDFCGEHIVLIKKEAKVVEVINEQVVTKSFPLECSLSEMISPTPQPSFFIYADDVFN
jgi:hypothetical protein